MIEVTVDSIRISLMNQQRVVLLKDIDAERYLAIWIGQAEADAITLELRERRLIKRPFTHDLLKNVIESMNGRLVHILVNDIRGDVYYARLVIELSDESTIEVDARPSDAIALAVRTKSPIFVAEAVIESSGIVPEEEIDLGEETRAYFSASDDEYSAFDMDDDDDIEFPRKPSDDLPKIDESQFSAFADFVNSLDLDELDDEDK